MRWCWIAFENLIPSINCYYSANYSRNINSLVWSLSSVLHNASCEREILLLLRIISARSRYSIFSHEWDVWRSCAHRKSEIRSACCACVNRECVRLSFCSLNSPRWAVSSELAVVYTYNELTWRKKDKVWIKQMIHKMNDAFIQFIIIICRRNHSYVCGFCVQRADRPTNIPGNTNENME